MPDSKSPEVKEFLDTMAMSMFGRTRSGAIGSGVCVICGNVVMLQKLTELEVKEYSISGMGKCCQDKVFKKDE